MSVPNIPGLGETTYLLPNGQVVSKLPPGYQTSYTATVPGAPPVLPAPSGYQPVSNATGIFPTLNPGGSITPASTGGGTGGGTNVFPTPTGAAPLNPTGSPSTVTSGGAGVPAGTSGNPFVDAAEWAANLLNLVPIIGPGIAAVLKDGVQAVAYMTHDLAYALDTAVSVFKPGQAWRFVFTGATVALGWFAFRAWTGQSMMPHPGVVPVPA